MRALAEEGVAARGGTCAYLERGWRRALDRGRPHAGGSQYSPTMTAGLTPNDTTRRAATDDGERVPAATPHSLWREGRRAGLIGAAAGALWSMLLDLVMGHPFQAWTFLGADFLGLFHVTAPPAVAALFFLVVVALVFMLLGRIAVVVAHRGDVQPHLILVANFVLTLVTLALIAFAAAFTTSRLGRDAWPQILGSPLVAFWAMGFRLYRTHPSLRSALTRAGDA